MLMTAPDPRHLDLRAPNVSMTVMTTTMYFSFFSLCRQQLFSYLHFYCVCFINVLLHHFIKLSFPLFLSYLFQFSLLEYCMSMYMYVCVVFKRLTLL